MSSSSFMHCRITLEGKDLSLACDLHMCDLLPPLLFPHCACECRSKLGPESQHDACWKWGCACLYVLRDISQRQIEYLMISLFLLKSQDIKCSRLIVLLRPSFKETRAEDPQRKISVSSLELKTVCFKTLNDSLLNILFFVSWAFHPGLLQV